MTAPEHSARRPRLSERLRAVALLGDEKLFFLRLATTFRPWQWLTVFLLILACDYITGPFIHSAILFYFIPIGMAAWSDARWGSVGLALLWPALRLGIMSLWGESWEWRLPIYDTMVDGIVSVAFASLVWHLVAKERELRILRGMLPICGFCKRIRNADAWVPVELYISRHSEAVFSHTFCPDCGERYYGSRYCSPDLPNNIS